MEDRNTGKGALTRRGFVAAAAVVGSCVSATGCSFHEEAGIQGSASFQNDVVQEASCCSACSAQCGYMAFSCQGKVGRLIGGRSHPDSKGSLCAFGYDAPALLEEEARLRTPMAKDDGGTFKAITWDEAYDRIAVSIGEATFAVLVDDADANGRYLCALAQAGGSSNVFAAPSDGGSAFKSGMRTVIGSARMVPDVEHAGVVILLGASSGKMTPGHIKRLADARANGAYIAVVDAMVPQGMPGYDLWLPVNPGTEAAVLLAVAHTLVDKGLYDSERAASQADGFVEWRDSLSVYTSMWAEGVSGVSAAAIESLASMVASALPSCAIDASCPGALQFGNAAESARVVAACNLLMGACNQAGGSFVVPEVAWDTDRQEDAQKCVQSRFGHERYPLACAEHGPLMGLVEALEAGEIDVAIIGDEAPLHQIGFARAQKALSQTSLSVAISSFLNPFVQDCDIVLPRCLPLEEDGLAVVSYGQAPVVSRPSAVVSAVDGVRSMREICSGLAQACGWSEDFVDEVEKSASDFLESQGLNAGSFSQESVFELSKHRVEVGSWPEFPTSTGRAQLRNSECAEAGALELCGWKPSEATALDGDSFWLLSAPIPASSFSYGISSGAMSFAATERMDRLIVNTERADRLGLQEDDLVEVQSTAGSCTYRVKLGEEIHPDAVFAPMLAESESESPSLLFDVQAVEGFGAPSWAGTKVVVRKVGA